MFYVQWAKAWQMLTIKRRPVTTTGTFTLKITVFQKQNGFIVKQTVPYLPRYNSQLSSASIDQITKVREKKLK